MKINLKVDEAAVVWGKDGASIHVPKSEPLDERVALLVIMAAALNDPKFFQEMKDRFFTRPL